MSIENKKKSKEYEDDNDNHLKRLEKFRRGRRTFP